MKLKAMAKSIRLTLKKADRAIEEASQLAYLSTSSTMLNLAISDLVYGGFLPGRYYFLVGDSNTGKSFFSVGCCAEACQNPKFDNYDLIYDNPEDGVLMDVRRLFGSKLEKRIKFRQSETIEDFYFAMYKRLKKNARPFIWVLDSMDMLTSEAEDEKFEENMGLHAKGKDGKGSYGDGKAKKNSENLRKILKLIRKSGSILIIISQTRDNLNPMAYEKKTRSGGKALRFYATTEIWTSAMGMETKTVNKVKRKIGNKILLKLAKNRITGKLHEVQASIFPSYGIDDIGSCVDYLTQEKHWKKSSGVIRAPELKAKGKREKIIALCESPKGHKRLMRAVQTCWDEVQEACDLQRQARYE